MKSSKCKTRLKIFFAYVRSKSKCKPESVVLTDENNTTLNSDAEIAGHFDCYFTSVFMREDYSNLPMPRLVCDLYTACAELQFNASTVSTTVSKLRLDKSMGPDGFAPKLLIEIKDLISYPLYLLFKKSLRYSYSG